MARLLKIIGILFGIVLALVAGVFGLIVVAGIFVVLGLLALFGKGRVNVSMNRGARAAPSSARTPAEPPGDVIEVETTRVDRAELK